MFQVTWLPSTNQSTLFQHSHSRYDVLKHAYDIDSPSNLIFVFLAIKYSLSGHTGFELMKRSQQAPLCQVIIIGLHQWLCGKQSCLTTQGTLFQIIKSSIFKAHIHGSEISFAYNWWLFLYFRYFVIFCQQLNTCAT